MGLIFRIRNLDEPHDVARKRTSNIEMYQGKFKRLFGCIKGIIIFPPDKFFVQFYA